jgi:hypothetical protein
MLFCNLHKRGGAEMGYAYQAGGVLSRQVRTGSSFGRHRNQSG